MAGPREPRRSLVSIFLRRALMSPDPDWANFGAWRPDDLAKAMVAAQRLVEVHGDNFLRDANVDGDTNFPYIRWQIVDIAGAGVRFDIPRSYVGKKVVRATVCSVRAHPQGEGSFLPSDQDYDDIVACISGVGYSVVKDEDDNVLGHISQSRWLEDHEVSYTDEDTNQTITEVGIVVEITYN